MTNLRYSTPDCAGGSQMCGKAPSEYAWNVNLNNGNSNINHQNNRFRVLACRRARASECQGASFRELFNAWQQARRQKVPSANQLQFETDWMDGLFELQRQINSRTWAPRPATCFIATRPKARQIHAPDFVDRIVHHWLVPQLEALWEPRFIHHSYANRRGKGSHAAVDALHAMMRQVASGHGGGWYLQLDIRNFFNSINRAILYRMLKAGMVRAGLPTIAQHVVHALLRHPIERQGVLYRCTASERARVPAHKRLENAAPGCGLPIGNLSSQFFANVYLDALDQFVKHVLKASRYVRYVDDFVIVHQDREQLRTWLEQIRAFLRDTLQLELKDDIRLRTLSVGIDFLGYVIFPTHRRVRARVVRHAESALKQWERLHVRCARARAKPADFRHISSVWASYSGHLARANSFRLRQRFHVRYPWLQQVCVPSRFNYRLEGRTITVELQNG